jgi:hypothetical protein
MDEQTLLQELQTLQRQQSFQTLAITAYLEGRVTGASSAEAYLYALDPTLQGKLSPKTPVWEGGQ